jgi:hypothetical protein
MLARYGVPYGCTMAVVQPYNCGLWYVTNPPLSCICQSATAKQFQTRHTSAKAARRLTRALRHRGLTREPQKTVKRRVQKKTELLL